MQSSLQSEIAPIPLGIWFRQNFLLHLLGSRFPISPEMMYCRTMMYMYDKDNRGIITVLHYDIVVLK